MDFIKKIIREELQKVINTLNETDFYKSLNLTKPVQEKNPKETIIYDYEAGRAFGGDYLETDISNINRYHLTEYLPKNQNEEQWSFEFYTVYKTTLMIDIKRVVIDNESFWTLQFGQLHQGETTPTLITSIENIEGYDNFVNVVNTKLGDKLDPSKY